MKFDNRTEFSQNPIEEQVSKYVNEKVEPPTVNLSDLNGVKRRSVEREGQICFVLFKPVGARFCHRFTAPCDQYHEGHYANTYQ